MISKNKKIKKDNFLKKHIEDIKKIAEKGRQKREKVKNMIQERKKEENVAYTFQQKVNKKYNDKIKKDFHERQWECSGFFNPIEAWLNDDVCFPTQYIEDIKESAEKGRKKLNDLLENRIKEEKENINYTFKPKTNKEFNKKAVKVKFIERQKQFLENKKQKIQNLQKESKNAKVEPTFKHIFNKKNKLQKKVKPIIKKPTSSTNAVNYCHKHTNDTFNNKTSYVNKYFFNKNNYNQQDVYDRLYADAQDRKARREKLLSDYLYGSNTVIDNNLKYKFEKKIINKPKR